MVQSAVLPTLSLSLVFTRVKYIFAVYQRTEYMCAQSTNLRHTYIRTCHYHTSHTTHPFLADCVIQQTVISINQGFMIQFQGLVSCLSSCFLLLTNPNPKHASSHGVSLSAQDHHLCKLLPRILTVSFGPTVNLHTSLFHASCARVGVLLLLARLIPLSRVTVGLVSSQVKAFSGQAASNPYPQLSLMVSAASPLANTSLLNRP